jgi:hypothetical protein
MLRGTRGLIAGLLFAPLRVILAQDTTVVTPPPAPAPVVDTLRCGFCNRPNPFLAVFEGLLAQGLNNRFNAWVRKDSTAYVTKETWRTNLHRGWHFDEDNFFVNMLGHPYAGSIHFNGARSNGLSFWASAPFTFFHSVVWEYFGETTQPSINDFVDTGLGGIALGEMFHRVAATIRNNEVGGGARFLRELVALPFDPMGSFNRLLDGEWSKKGPNPSEHNPLGTVLRMGGGAGIVRAPGSLLTSLKDAEFTSAFMADLKYGDSYIDSLRKPFAAFSARLLFAPGHGGLTQLVGVGRVTGAEIGRTEWHRHQIELNHRFEYLNNGALRFGAQTLELGLSSRIHIAGKFWFRTLMAGDGIALAGINAPGTGTGTRDYDFGPGLGGTFFAGIEHAGAPILTGRYQPAWIHTVNGANANHYTSFASLELNLPVFSHLDLVAQSSYYDRLSKYADGSRSRRRFPELRAFLAFKTARRSAAEQ